MKTKYFLGIDLGTSSVKVIATTSENKIIGEVSREYPIYYPHEKWAEQAPEDWWAKTLGAITDLLKLHQIPPDSIAAIGFSGQMHGLVALDKDNQVLFPAILWCDQRTEEECKEITGSFGLDKLREYTGNKALAGFTAPKLLWVKKNRPEQFRKIAHILLPKDYLRFKLTGDFATDVSDASGTLMFDVKNRCWSKPMCDYLELRKEQLPQVYESFEVTGKVSQDIKKRLGLTGEILVVGGAGDQAAGAIGTGTVEEGVISVTLGTSGVVFAAHQDYVVDSSCRLHAFCHANGRYHSMGVMLSAASCLKWWAEDIQAGTDIGTLLNEANEIGSSRGLIFLPYLLGERTPYPDPDAKGCFLGMDANTKRGNMTFAILEGVAFGLRDSLEILKDLNIPLKHVRVIGGGAKSVLWIQILANIFGMDIEEINTNEGGALGAAILAAVGAGSYKTVDEGCKSMIHVVNSISPINEKLNYYNNLYPKYQSAYQSLCNWYKPESHSVEGDLR